MDKEIRISLSIFWDIALQGGNEVTRDLSNSFIYGKTSQGAIRAMGKEVLDTLKVPKRVPNRSRVDTPLTLIIIPFTLVFVRTMGIKSSTTATCFLMLLI